MTFPLCWCQMSRPEQACDRGLESGLGSEKRLSWWCVGMMVMVPMDQPENADEVEQRGTGW